MTRFIQRRVETAGKARYNREIFAIAGPAPAMISSDGSQTRNTPKMPTHPGRKAQRIAAATLVAAACSILVSSAQSPAGTLPLVPTPERGASVTPAFEGWYQNADGSYSFL